MMLQAAACGPAQLPADCLELEANTHTHTWYYPIAFSSTLSDTSRGIDVPLTTACVFCPRACTELAHAFTAVQSLFKPLLRRRCVILLYVFGGDTLEESPLRRCPAQPSMARLQCPGLPDMAHHSDPGRLATITNLAGTEGPRPVVLSWWAGLHVPIVL